MESSESVVVGLGQDDESLKPTQSLLPRPCSMPSFVDKNRESIEKRNFQTLPFKSSSKRSLSFKPWKSMSSSCGSFLTSPTFGTPSYPAHLDTIRAKSACLSTADIASHPEELNNNCIFSSDSLSNEEGYDQVKDDMFLSDKNLAESLHSFSYTNGYTRGTFANSPVPGLGSSLNASWQFFNFVGGADAGTALPTTTRNPNKALLTIDAKTSKILVANEIACKLFGYQSEDLTGMKMSKLFAMKDGVKHDALLEQHIDTEGNIVMVSGKVIEAVNSAGNIMAVSLWMKRFKSDDDPRCIAIIEPIQRSVGSILFNAEGTIVDCDCQFAYLHGYTSPEEVVGLLIQNLIPSIVLPIPGQEIKKHIKKQRATGKARNNSRFPVSVKISEYDKDFHELYLRRGEPDEIQFSKFLYKGIIWVFSNISGLVSVLPDGQIHSCNSNFSLMLFGCSEDELIGKDITTLIPSFHDQMDLAEDRSLKIPSLSEDEDVQLDPNRDTALSGKFDFESSSQSEFESDSEGHLGEPESLEIDPERGCGLDSSSDQTATSSVTIGSSNNNLSEASSNCGREFVKSSSPIKERLSQESTAQSPSEFCAHPFDVVRMSSPIKNPRFADIKTDDKKSEHYRKDSDSSYTTLKSDSSCCADSTERSSTVSSCSKSCCRSENFLITNTSEFSKSDRLTSFVDCDGGDSESSPISCAGNRDLNYDRKKLVMASDVSDDDGLKSENCAAEMNLGDCDAENHRKVFDGINSQEHFKASKKHENDREIMLQTQKSFDMDEEMLKKNTEEYLLNDMKNKLRISSDESYEFEPEKEEKIILICKDNLPTNNCKNFAFDRIGRQEEMSLTCDKKLDDQCLINAPYTSNSSHSGQRGNEFVTRSGSVIVDRTNEAIVDPLSPKKQILQNGSEKFADDEKVNMKNRMQQEQFTSTPKLDRTDSQSKRIYEGNFCGQARHKDESLLPIVFQVKQIALNQGKALYCVWVSRDPEDQDESYRLASQLMLAGSFNSTLNTSHGNFADAMKSYNDLSISLNEDNLTFKGKYDEQYMTLKSIGKGAFGFVKLAQRRSDSLEVVVKFVQKSKIVPASWIDDPVLGRVPLEIAFLAKLEHHNIVKMHEVFENDDFFQLVMEKHGEGIDLFEFIDRQPALDEPLCSYMFRQILSAVSYLHSKNILHRDVKDENIIIDKNFTLKLIDFGSAVFMETGKLFSTFCGTVEYCSPEVLLGNKYHGPELEVWSLGITLYTVVFGENPFFDVEETINAELQPPFKVSTELMFLICWMLHPEPSLRATIKDIEHYKWVNQKVDIGFYNYDTIFPENKDGYNTDQEDHSLDYDNNYEDDGYEDYLKENELLEEEYMRYLTRQRSLPDYPEREHGASF